jgi:uncharacterized protein YdeI (YjbR/CyaY-like superfamily)
MPYPDLMAAINDRELLFFATATEWEEWLSQNHEHDGIRLQLRKQSTTKPGMLYSEALDPALCWGWVDGQRGSIDGEYYFNAYSPRRARSPWSQINRDHIERLTAEGKMREPGLAQVAAAKADGRWDAAYRQKDAPVPDDLRAALGASPSALELFEALNSQNRFAILFRISAVKREETRARKIAEYVSMLERGETIYPQRPKP